MSAESTKVKLVDPFNYKKKYGFSPAIVVENVSKTIYVSGQCSMDQDGNVVNQNDFDAQIDVVFQNIEKVLIISYIFLIILIILISLFIIL